MDKKIKRLQRMALFGMKGFYTEEEGACINPFYGYDDDVLQENIEYAKEIYSKVFHSLRDSVYFEQGNFEGFPNDKRMECLIV